MSENYSAREIFSDQEESEVQVMSKNCSYLVWTDEEQLYLKGPGVKEEIEIEENWPDFSVEDRAIYVVMLFENGLLP